MSRHLSVLIALTATCATAAPNDSVYRDRIQPLLQQHCGSCHSASAASGGLIVGSFDQLMAGGKHGRAITPGNAAQSLIMQYIKGEQNPKMPLGGTLPEDAVAKLTAAINEMTPLVEAKNAVDAYMDWLLHKPKPPALPAIQNKAWVKNPIDSFILAKLEAKNLMPAPAASRRSLIRRAYFDLIGVPPTPEEVQAFVTNDAPDAYEKLIDKLLADSRYGERWARHWLDLARFAESDGFAIDGERPTAWRYRDYVIRSFNKDKPYDQFIKEQLAGDEMERGGDRSERLTALGFLRMGTWEADANFKTQLRQDVLNEITATTTQVFLGLTVGCARCHDHKYDPIPQRDFYRIQAFFAATKVEDRPAPFLEVENPALMKLLMRQYEDESEVATAEFKKTEERFKQKYIAAKGLKPDDKSADDFRKVLKDHKDPAYTDAERKEYEAARDRARKLSDAMPRYRPVAYSVADVVPPQVPSVADTYVLAGGELANKGEKVEPGFLSCVLGKTEPATIPFSGGSSGRRIALASWIANADNPVTARVMVNRLWQHHFGDGLIRTPSDFGKNGDRPVNPELLDYLATQFVEKKWSLKAMHKLMLVSNAYQQSTEHPETKKFAEIDPDNSLLWRMNWQRLEAETLRDSVLAVAGRLEKSPGGPGVFLDVPADVAEGFEFFKWFPSDEKEQRRRTIYTFQRRSVMNQMVEVFDGANMSESCARRSSTTVAPQAFTLLNSEFTNNEAQHFARRVIELAGPDSEKQIEKAFWLALNRAPSTMEKEKASALYGKAKPEQALTRLGVVLFNLNEFLYLD
jgi:hypothetical protein